MVPVDLVGEADLADGQHHLGLDLFRALETAIRHRRADGLSISCCEVTPTILRNLRSDMLRLLSFMAASWLRNPVWPSIGCRTSPKAPNLRRWGEVTWTKKPSTCRCANSSRSWA